MDIEGGELLALQGAPALLGDPARRPCLMAVEFTPGKKAKGYGQAFCNLLAAYHLRNKF